MKLYIRFCRPFNECLTISLKRLLITIRWLTQIIFKPKDGLTNAFGMQFAGSVSCQKFWIG